MKYLILIASISLSMSCRKADVPINNLNGGKIGILGHAGMGIEGQYPANSFPSVLRCLNMNSDGSELDVQLTQDGVLVVYKDELLSTHSDCNGRVGEINWESYKDCRQEGLTPANSYSLYSINELLIAHPLEANDILTFDLKLFDYNSTEEHYLALAMSIKLLCEMHNICQQIHVESSNDAFLALMDSLKPGMKLFVYPSDLEDGIQRAKALNLYGITTSMWDLTQETVQDAQDLGFRVAVWDVYTKEANKYAVDLHPDFIQTNKVNHLIRYLGRNQ